MVKIQISMFIKYRGKHDTMNCVTVSVPSHQCSWRGWCESLG